MTRRPSLIGAAALTFVMCLAPAADAQTGIDAVTAEPGGQSVVATPRTWQVGPWFGGARHSPVTMLLGTTPGRDHLFIGIQASTPVRRVGGGRLAYSVQVLPVVAISGRTAPLNYPGQRAPDGLLPGADRTYAWGFSPVGLELTTPQARRLSAFTAAAGGVLVFTRPFPVPEARRLNFTLEYGVGVRLRTHGEQWLQLGYKFHHLSNAYTAEMNPGLDGHVLYAGYQWSARLPR